MSSFLNHNFSWRGAGGERVREIIADFHKRYPLPAADGEEKKDKPEKPEKATKSSGKKRDTEAAKG